MTPLDKLNNITFDKNILKLHSNNHIRRKHIRDILTKELLKYLFEDMNFTANHIAINILQPKGYKNICAGQLIDLCKEYGIKTLSIKDSAKLKLTRDKYKKTCIIKYGAENCLSKNTSIYKKRDRNILKKYGVKNVFQLDAIKAKSKQTLFKKYGVYSPVDLPTFTRNCGRISYIHKKIETFLKNNNIEFMSEDPNKFRKFNKKFNREYSPRPDILLKNKNIAIEIYGDRWHANPKFYKKSDVICLWRGLKTAEQIWKYDKIRVNHIKSFGYKVIILWGHDIIKNFEKITKKLLKIVA